MVTARTQARSPERVTARLIQTFAAKLVFLGAYLVAMLRAVGVVSMTPAPFLVGFVATFVAWHAMEAVWLSRLRAPASSEGTRRS